MTVGYHVTDVENVGAIRRWGLIPRDTGKHKYQYEADGNHGVEAVYFFTTAEAADAWLTRWHRGERPQGYWTRRPVIVTADIEGLPVEPDPVLTADESENYLADDDPRRSAVRVLERVTPDRILEVV